MSSWSAKSAKSQLQQTNCRVFHSHRASYCCHFNRALSAPIHRHCSNCRPGKVAKKPLRHFLQLLLPPNQLIPDHFSNIFSPKSQQYSSNFGQTLPAENFDIPFTYFVSFFLPFLVWLVKVLPSATSTRLEMENFNLEPLSTLLPTSSFPAPGNYAIYKKSTKL